MLGQRTTVRDALRLLREPVWEEKRRLLRDRWAALDPRWRLPGQGFGQQATGCGATIGVHPRCDFDCTGCYLGSAANRIEPLPLEDTFRQLEALRAHLGPKGNVQITDGEVTLLPAEDLIAILRHARAIGLIPMVMTHGDTFRRKLELLPRLMTEGHLTELSIHIDITQRGRLGYRQVTREADLDPLREEFAEMIRAARRRTRRPLRAAMTLTITPVNLDDVPRLVEWCLQNRDVFGILSFQPLARVGRTREGLVGVAADALWERIAPVLASYGLERTDRGPLRFGHPDCSRVEAMGVYQRGEERPRLLPIVREGHEEDLVIMREFLRRGLGGINFRDDLPLERLCRLIGVILTSPGWFFGALGSARARIAALGIDLEKLAIDALRRRIRLDAFTVVSHHFMSPDELATDRGRERLAACVFRLPVDGRMVSMCEVNATGLRDTVHAGIETPRAHPGTGAPAPWTDRPLLPVPGESERIASPPNFDTRLEDSISGPRASIDAGVPASGPPASAVTEDPLLSIVIPVRDEEERIEGALRTLATWRETEIVVAVDRRTCDASPRLARSFEGVRVLDDVGTGRGEALAAGARASRGRFLLFLHADGRIDETSVRRAIAILEGDSRSSSSGSGAPEGDARWRFASPRPGDPAKFRRWTRVSDPIVALAFGIRLDSPRRVFRFLERGINLRARVFQLPYGDQGLLLTREAYDAAGGFRSLERCEDLDLVLRLRRLGRVALAPGSCSTSTRRWDRDGLVKVTGSNLATLARFLLAGAPLNGVSGDADTPLPALRALPSGPDPLDRRLGER